MLDGVGIHREATGLLALCIGCAIAFLVAWRCCRSNCIRDARRRVTSLRVTGYAQFHKRGLEAYQLIDTWRGQPRPAIEATDSIN